MILAASGDVITNRQQQELKFSRSIPAARTVRRVDYSVLLCYSAIVRAFRDSRGHNTSYELLMWVFKWLFTHMSLVTNQKWCVLWGVFHFKWQQQQTWWPEDMQKRDSQYTYYQSHMQSHMPLVYVCNIHIYMYIHIDHHTPLQIPFYTIYLCIRDPGIFPLGYSWLLRQQIFNVLSLYLYGEF